MEEYASLSRWEELLEKARENLENRYIDFEMAVASLKVAEEHVAELKKNQEVLNE
jgi:hypothetical protein